MAAFSFHVKYWNGYKCFFVVVEKWNNIFLWFQMLRRWTIEAEIKLFGFKRCVALYIIIEKWNIDAEITLFWLKMFRRKWNIETEIALFFWFQMLRRCGEVKLSCFNLNSLSERAAQRKPRIFVTSFSIFS